MILGASALVGSLFALHSFGMLRCRSDEPDRSSYYERDEHGSYRKNPLDPTNAYVSGVVLQGGKPVADVHIEATVLPRAYSWTVDEAVTDDDGTFTMPITSNHLSRKQQVELRVVGDLRGRAVVEVEPGRVTSDARIDVGSGVRLHGVVQEASGEPARGRDSAGVSVCFGRTCEHVRADGSFELHVDELGPHRLSVVSGGVSHYVKTLPLLQVAPRVTLDELEGERGPFAMQIDSAAADAMFNGPSWSESTAVGQVKVRLVPKRNTATVDSIMCMTPHGGIDITVTSNKAVDVPLLSAAGRTFVDCDTGRQQVRFSDVSALRSLDLPVFNVSGDEVDLGVELRPGPTGPRVIDVADEAKAAGLLPGDIVTMIDDVDVTSTTTRIVHALGFELPRGQKVGLTVDRSGQQLLLPLASPSPRSGGR